MRRLRRTALSLGGQACSLAMTEPEESQEQSVQVCELLQTTMQTADEVEWLQRQLEDERQQSGARFGLCGEINQQQSTTMCSRCVHDLTEGAWSSCKSDPDA